MYWARSRNHSGEYRRAATATPSTGRAADVVGLTAPVPANGEGVVGVLRAAEEEEEEVRRIGWRRAGTVVGIA